MLYSYWLGSRTRTVLFDPRTNLCTRVKQNCRCPRSQSINVLLYTFIFPNFLIHSFHALTYQLDIFYILVRQVENLDDASTLWRQYIKWLIEPMKIRLSFSISIAGNRSTNCWPVNRTVLQLIGIWLLTVKMSCIYFI